MGFLKRLFTGSSNIVRNKSGQLAPSPSDPTGECAVPADHHVIFYRPTMEPATQRTHGGGFLINLGSASDEFQEELRQIVDEVDRSISVADRTAFLLAADPGRVSELFAPNDVKVNSLAGLLLWIIDAGSAHLWLRQPEPLLAAVHRASEYRLNAGPMTQFVFFGIQSHPTATAGVIRGGNAPRLDAPPGTLELARLLSNTGVPVFAVPQDGVFFIEVCRPDATIGALRTAPLPRASVPDGIANKQAAPDASYGVVRAPYLRRLTLAAIEMPTAETSHRLFEALLSRMIPLLVMCDREGRTHLRSWEGVGEAVPVYPDLSSLIQASKDLSLAPGSLAWAHFLPRDLFTWVDQKLFGGIALNAYKDSATPMYFFLDRAQVSALASGRIPDALTAAPRRTS